jgi:hypothetical protein
MDEKFAVLRHGPNYNTTDGHGYNTLKQAADDGAVVMAYGYLYFHYYLRKNDSKNGMILGA